MDKTVNILYEDVIALLKAATGIPDAKVMRGDQNIPKLTGEYISVLHMGESQEGLAFTTFTRSEDLEPHQLHENNAANLVHVFSIQAFRGQPMERLRKLAMFTQSSVGSEFMFTKGVVLRVPSEPTNTNYVIGENWINRAAIQISIGAMAKTQHTINKIEEVEVTVNQDVSFVETFVIQAPPIVFGFAGNLDAVGFNEKPFKADEV